MIKTHTNTYEEVECDICDNHVTKNKAQEVMGGYICDDCFLYWENLEEIDFGD